MDVCEDGRSETYHRPLLFAGRPVVGSARVLIRKPAFIKACLPLAHS